MRHSLPAPGGCCRGGQVKCKRAMLNRLAPSDRRGLRCALQPGHGSQYPHSRGGGLPPKLLPPFAPGPSTRFTFSRVQAGAMPDPTPYSPLEHAMEVTRGVIRQIATSGLLEPNVFGNEYASKLLDNPGLQVDRQGKPANQQAWDPSPMILSMVSSILSTQDPKVHFLVMANLSYQLAVTLGTISPSEDVEDDDLTWGGASAWSTSDCADNDNPLIGKSQEEIACHLIHELREPDHNLKAMMKKAESLGPEIIWDLLKQVAQEMESDSVHNSTVDGTRKRTPGGVFFKLAKRAESKISRQQEELLAPTFQLRDYQQRVVEEIEHKGGNWVVASPTGSGKTAIFIELTKRLLARNPSAKVVVIVPTKNLAVQQCVAYEKAGFRSADNNQGSPRAAAVKYYNQDQSLRKEEWMDELSRLGVMVMVHDMLLNVLRNSDEANIGQIDLLVIDECHHTNKDHPYAQVMSFVQEAEPTQKPQVLGFSASPVYGGTIEAVVTNLHRLRQTLDAKLIVVPEEDTDVEKFAPSPSEESNVVLGRKEDKSYQEEMVVLLAKLVNRIDFELRSNPSIATGNIPIPDEDAVDAVKLVLTCNEWAAKVLSSVKEALQSTGEDPSPAQQRGFPNLMAALQLLKAVQSSALLAHGLGYEASLTYLARRCVSLVSSAKETEAVLKELLKSPPMLISPVLDRLRQVVQDVPLTGLTLPQAGGDISGGFTGADPFGGIPMTLKDDISLLPQDLCRTEILPLLENWRPQDGPWPDDVHVLHQATAPFVQGTLLTPALCSPKVWELITLLQTLRDKDDFHGIIFVRTRQAAHCLAQLLSLAMTSVPPNPPPPNWKPGAEEHNSSEALLGFVDDVQVLTGHGQSAKQSLSPGLPKSVGGAVGSGGMKSGQQQRVLDRFKLPGRRLLVATNVAEEGLDIQSCNLVVRFDPPQSGVQRQQGRGRARMAGAIYVTLVQEGVCLISGRDDEKDNETSMMEEEVQRRVLKSMHHRQA